MSLIVLTSVNGSPGVSTTALGLALAWHRPVVLVEADPTGASAFAAGYFQGLITPRRTVIDLAVSHRQGQLVEDLPKMLISVPESQVKLLSGPSKHSQSRAMMPVWDSLAAALKGLDRTGQDVIVDAGRLGLEGYAFKMLTAADAALVLTRSTAPALVAAQSWVASLREAFTTVGAADALGLCVVDEGKPYKAREISRGLRTPVRATLPWDPASAASYSYGSRPGRKHVGSPLQKALTAAARSIASTITKAEEGLELNDEGATSA